MTDSYAKAGGYIRALGPGEVPAATARLGEETLRAVSRALAMPPPRLMWVESCEADHPDAAGPLKANLCGLTPMSSWRRETGDLVVVVHRGSCNGIVKTTSHETRHAWQVWRGLSEVWDKDRLERDAHRFDQLWRKRSNR